MSGTTSRDPYVYLLKYDGTKFVSFRNIQMDSRPYGITYVKAGSEHYLAVAFYDLPQSKILKWNGETFEVAQEIGSSKVKFLYKIIIFESKVVKINIPTFLWVY